jgi:hypothetical protein
MPTLTEQVEVAKALHASRSFRTPSWEAALAVTLYGQELGLGPVSSLMSIVIVQGKPALSAAGVGALLQRSGRFDYRVAALDDRHASLEFFALADGQRTPIGTSTFTLEDARQAGLNNSPTWKSYPRNLLLARALTNGVRWFAPSVTLGGIYTPEELGQPIDEDDAGLPVAPSPESPATPMNGPPTPMAPAAPPAPATGPAITLEGLVSAYGADAVFEAAGGALPASDVELRAVAAQLAATVPTAGAAEALKELADAAAVDDPVSPI